MRHKITHPAIIISALCAAAMVVLYCTEFEFNNPHDPANRGACSVDGTCVNDVARSSCAGVFVVGGTCQFTTFTHYCVPTCAATISTSATPAAGCFTNVNTCILNLPPVECTAGENCPTDLGSCTIGDNCTNNVQRENCTGTFVFGETCPVTPSPITQYCPSSESCFVVDTSATLIPHCFETLQSCEMSLCTSGTNCPTDLGSCIVSGNCTNNVARESCISSFVFGGTCPTNLGPPPQGNGHGHFNPNINYGTFTDARDGQTYRTVIMPDGKIWMAENLNFAADSSWCYDDDPSNCALYGRLYNWPAAMNISQSFVNTLWNGNDANHQGICPSGWRVPSDNDWGNLMVAVGGTDGWDWWNDAGRVLKSQTGWSTEVSWWDGDLFHYIPGTNEFGFSALPGGSRGSDGSLYDVGEGGIWWSATEFDVRPDGGGGAGTWHMSNYGSGVVSLRELINKSMAHSLRCVMD